MYLTFLITVQVKVQCTKRKIISRQYIVKNWKVLKTSSVTFMLTDKTVQIWVYSAYIGMIITKYRRGLLCSCSCMWIYEQCTGNNRFVYHCSQHHHKFTSAQRDPQRRTTEQKQVTHTWLKYHKWEWMIAEWVHLEQISTQDVWRVKTRLVVQKRFPIHSGKCVDHSVHIQRAT